jgi:uncharacterized protein
VNPLRGLYPWYHASALPYFCILTPEYWMMSTGPRVHTMQDGNKLTSPDGISMCPWICRSIATIATMLHLGETMSCVSNPLLRLRFATLLLLAIVAFPVAQAQIPSQRPAGYVSDFAGVLSPEGRQRLEALCKELDEKSHAQLAVVTVNSLEGRPIEDFSIDLATKWGIGHKGGPRDEKADRGGLLLLAIQDRQDRIEVGYGLEPIITDGRAGSILRSMTPNLRSGDYDGALWVGAASIAQPIAQQAGITLTSLAGGPPLEQPQEDSGNPFGGVLMILIVLGILIVLNRRGVFTGDGFYGGGWGGGGFSSSGGGGGGGFGGFGGGSFGGGGSSGSW